MNDNNKNKYICSYIQQKKNNKNQLPKGSEYENN